MMDQNADQLDADQLLQVALLLVRMGWAAAKVPFLQRRMATDPSLIVSLAEQATNTENALVATRCLMSWRQCPTHPAEHLAAFQEMTDSDAQDRASWALARVMAHSEADDDERWPATAVCEVLELADDDLHSSFSNETLNRFLGVTKRNPLEGATHESKLAEQLDNQASNIANSSPRAAALLRSTADSARNRIGMLAENSAERRRREA